MPAIFFLIVAGGLIIIYLLQNGPQFDQTQGDQLLVSVQIQALALAIEKAEGYGIPGAIPTVANNPGDLVVPGWTGAKLGSAGISVFSSYEEGKNHLYYQLQLIANGQSHIYTLDDTISSMAKKWTATAQDNWANIVSGELGVSSDTTLRDILFS